MVCQAKITACFDVSLACARNSSLDQYTRVGAIKATFATVATSEKLKVHDALLASIASPDEVILSAILASLAPTDVPAMLLSPVVDGLEPPRLIYPAFSASANIASALPV